MNAFFANVKYKAFRKCIIVPVGFLYKLSYFTFSTSNHVFIVSDGQLYTIKSMKLGKILVQCHFLYLFVTGPKMYCNKICILF